MRRILAALLVRAMRKLHRLLLGFAITVGLYVARGLGLAAAPTA